MTRCWAMAASLAVLAGCPAKAVVVDFAGAPDDALVTIDDRYVGKLGRLAERGVALEPGTYRVTVEQVGYFPHDEIVEVTEEAGGQTVQVRLTPIPD